MKELSGSNLAILGVGPIGRALVGKAAALGMHVRVMRRHGERRAMRKDAFPINIARGEVVDKRLGYVAEEGA